MSNLASDDLLRRRITALHIGMVLVVLALLLGPAGVSSLRTPAGQLLALGVGLALALVLERRLRGPGDRRG